MKKLTFFVTLAVLVILTIAVASAQSGLPGSGWWSGEQVQNVSGSSTSIVLTAYDMDGSGSYTETLQDLAAGAAYTFTPFNAFATMPPGFQGSAVISAGGPVKAIVNVTNQPVSGPPAVGVPGGKAAAQYQGTDGSATANTLYFPLAKGDHYGKTTTFFVQNASSTDSVTGATATFTMRNGDSYTYNVPTIQPNLMVLFSIFDTNYNGNVANDGKVGNLVVQANQPIAGVVMEHDTSANPAVVLNSTRGFTQADFTMKAYAPVVKNSRYGRFTGIQVQNVSGGSINVTVDYKGTAGTCAGQTYTDSKNNVATGTAATFVQLAANGTNLPSDCVASATITASGNFVAIVNEQEVSGAPKAGITYSAMSDGAATSLISVPLFKDRRYGATTGLQIQNVGNAAATNWTATFNCKAVGEPDFVAISSPAKTGPIPAGGAKLFWQPWNRQDWFTASNPFAAAGANCAVTIQADQPIVAVANESPVTPGALDDNNYEGFNLTP
jgi:hypothetical protein